MCLRRNSSGWGADGAKRLPGRRRLVGAAGILGGIFLLSALLGPSMAVAALTAEEHFQRGTDLAAKGDISTAVIHLRKAIQQDPTGFEARLVLGRILLDAGFAEAAEREIVEARNLGAPRASWLLLFAEASLRQNRPEMVIKVLGAETNPDAAYESRVAVLLGKAALQQRDLEGARRDFSRGLKLSPDSIEALLGLAAVALEEGDTDTAAGRVQRALASNDANFDAWLLKGGIDRVRRAYSESLAAFDKAQKLRPDSTLPVYARAGTLIDSKKFDEARKSLETQMISGGEVAIGLYQLGRIAFETEHYGQAKDALERALRLDPEHDLSHLLLGTVLYRGGEHLVAAEHLKKYIEKYPDQAAPRKILAASYAAVGAYGEAVELLEDSLSRGMKDSQTLAMLGTAYLRTRQVDRGIGLLEDAVALDPQNQAARGELATALVLSGHSADALARLDSVVAMGDGSVDIAVLHVVALLNEKKYDQAIASARNLQARSEQRAMGFAVEGLVLVAMGRGDEARGSFQKALEIDPAFLSARLNLASLDILDGKMEQAQKRYAEVLKQDESNIEALLGLARISKRNGELPEMAVHLQRARAADPKAVAPRAALIDYLLTIGENLEAVVVARELVEQHPESLDSARSLGMTLMKSGDLEGASGVFRRMTDMAPDDPQAHTLLAQSEFAGKRFATARAALDKALEFNPQDWTLLAAKGNLAGQTGRFDEALNIGRRLQATQPKRPEGYLLEGDVLREQEDFQEAAERFEIGMKEAPNGEMAAKLHQTLRNLGKDEEANRVLTDWLESTPDDVIARQLLTQSLLDGRKYVDALRHLRKLNELTPNDLVVINNLAWVLSKLNVPEAVSYAARAYELNPNSPDVLDTYGWALVQDGKIGQGLDLLRKAAADAPNRLEVRYHYAVGLFRSAQFTEAREELRKILRLKKDFESRSSAVALLESLKAQAN